MICYAIVSQLCQVPIFMIACAFHRELFVHYMIHRLAAGWGVVCRWAKYYDFFFLVPQNFRVKIDHFWSSYLCSIHSIVVFLMKIGCDTSNECWLPTIHNCITTMANYKMFMNTVLRAYFNTPPYTIHHSYMKSVETIHTVDSNTSLHCIWMEMIWHRQVKTIDIIINSTTPQSIQTHIYNIQQHTTGDHRMHTANMLVPGCDQKQNLRNGNTREKRR